LLKQLLLLQLHLLTLLMLRPRLRYHLLLLRLPLSSVKKRVRSMTL
jgi:hypothetical protein